MKNYILYRFPYTGEKQFLILRKKVTKIVTDEKIFKQHGTGNYGQRIEYIKNNISEFVSPIKLTIGKKVYIDKLKAEVEILELGSKFVKIKTSFGEMEAGYNNF